MGTSGSKPEIDGHERTDQSEYGHEQTDQSEYDHEQTDQSEYDHEQTDQSEYDHSGMEAADVQYICKNIEQFRPFGAEHYVLPVEAAVVALLSGPTKPDITMALACMSRCVIDYLVGPTLRAWVRTKLSFYDGEAERPDEEVAMREIVWVYGEPYQETAEYRRVAWAPDPSATLSGWRLGKADPEDATSVSKDLLWLMLVCRKISGEWDIPDGCEIGIIKYFSPRELVGVLERPASILPYPAGNSRIQLLPKDTVIHNVHYELNLPYCAGLQWVLLSTVLMRDEWWDLYRSSLMNGRSHTKVDLNDFMYMDSMMTYLYGILPIGYELRILDLISAAGKDVMPPKNKKLMCMYAALYSKGPALRAALALPDQIYAFRQEAASIIATRPKLGPELFLLLLVYLRACGPGEIERGILHILGTCALGTIRKCGFVRDGIDTTDSSSILELYMAVDLLVDATRGLPPIPIVRPPINKYNILLILALAPCAEVRLGRISDLRLLQETSIPYAEPDSIRLAAQYAVYSGRAPDMREALRMVKGEIEGWVVEGWGTVGSILGPL